MPEKIMITIMATVINTITMMIESPIIITMGITTTETEMVVKKKNLDESTYMDYILRILSVVIIFLAAFFFLF